MFILKEKAQRLRGYRSGFTLLEFLIVSTVLVILAVVAINSFGGFSRKAAIDSAARAIISDLRTVQSKAVAGTDADSGGSADDWGICFVHAASGDYYQTVGAMIAASCKTTGYDTASGGVVQAKIFLPSGVTYSTADDWYTSPGFDAIVFNKISGTPSTTDNVIVITSSLADKITTVSSDGLITQTSVDITSVVPTSGINTNSAFQFTQINGHGFASGASVSLQRNIQGTVNTISCTGASVNATGTQITGATCNLTLDKPASCTGCHALAGKWDVLVTNTDTTSATLPGGLTVTANPPTVTTIVPTSTVNDDTSAHNTLTTVNGSNFQAGATVQLTRSGTTINCDTTSSTIVAGSISSVTCNDIGGALGASDWNVVVTNTLGDGASATCNPASCLTINNPTPTIAVGSLTPNRSSAGDSVDITLVGDSTANNGHNFATNAKVKWDCTSDCTTDASSTGISNVVVNWSTDTITATVASSLTTTAGSPHAVKVFNPTPGGGISTNSEPFTVSGGATFGITGLKTSGSCPGSASVTSNNAGSFAFDICGSGFSTISGDVKVTLHESGQPTITCSGFTVAANLITGASCDLTNVAVASDWDVWVTNLSTDSTAKCSDVGGTGPTPRCEVIVTAQGVSVGSITPANGIQFTWNQPILAISGTSFSGTPTVTLTNGGSTITCTGFTVASSTLLINGSCPITNTTAATTWTVHVIVGASDATCACFSIVTAANNATLTPIARFWFPAVGGSCGLSACGTGSWSTTNTLNWATTPTGLGTDGITPTTGATVPTTATDVYFTKNSFTADGETVTVSNPASASSLVFSGPDGVSKNITFTGGAEAITLGDATHDGSLNFQPSCPSTCTITRSGETGDINFKSGHVGQVANFAAKDTDPSSTQNSFGKVFFNNGGTYTFINPYNSNTAASNDIAILNSTTVNTNNNALIFGSLTFSSGTFNLGTSTVTLKDSGSTSWSVTGGTLNAASSTIAVSPASSGTNTFLGGGKTYSDVTFSSNNTNVTLDSDAANSTFNDITFSNTGTVAYGAASQATTAHDVKFNNTNQAVTVNGTANVFYGIVVKCQDTCAGDTGAFTLSSGSSSTFYKTAKFNNTTGGTSISGSNTFTGAVTSAGTVSITGSSNTFSSTLDIGGSGNLTVSASQTSNDYKAAVTVAGNATLESGNHFESTLTISGTTASSMAGASGTSANNFDDVVRFGGSTTIKGTNNTFAKTLCIGTNSGCTTGSGDLIFHNTTNDNLVHDNTFTGAVTVMGVLTMNTLPYANTFGANGHTGAILTVNGTTASSISGKGSGTAGNKFNGDVSIAGTTNINADNNEITGSFTTTGSSHVNNLVLTGSAGHDNKFDGAVTVDGVLNMNTSNTNTFSGAVTVNGTGTSTVSTGNTFDVGAPVIVSGALSLGSTNTFRSTVNITGVLTAVSTNHFDDSTHDTLTCNDAANPVNVCVAGTTLSSMTDSNTFAGNVKFSGVGGSARVTMGSGNQVNNQKTFKVMGSGNSSVIGTSLLPNSFTGTMYFGGQLTISGTNNTFGDTSGDTLTLNTGDLIFSSGASTNTFAGAVAITAGVLNMQGTTNTNTNQFLSTLTAGGSGASTISSGTSTGTKNTFAGLATFTGRLDVGNWNAFSATPTSLTVAGTGTSTMGQDNSFSGAVSFSNAGSDLTLAATSGHTNTFSGALTVSGTGAFTGTAYANNTFSGAVNIANSAMAVGLNTWNTGSSLTLTGASPALSGGNTFKDVTLSGGGTATVTGTNSFVNLTRNPAAAATSDGITFPASVTQTVSGTLTLTGHDLGSRLFVTSGTPGTRATLSAATVALSNSNFQDIAATGTGTKTGPACDDVAVSTTWCGVSLGDNGNNTGIHFSATKTWYWKSAGNTGNWSDSSKWASNSAGTTLCTCVPLPQDTSIFNANSFNTGSQIIHVDVSRIGAIDFTGVTNAPQISFDTATTIMGDPATNDNNIITMTSGTGSPTIAGTTALTFGNVGVRKKITSATKTFTMPIVIDATGGKITLVDALSISNTLTLTNGTLDANNQAVSVTTFDGSNSNTRGLVMGTGTWTLSGTGTVWNLSTTTNLTYTAPTSPGLITMNGSSTSAKNFNGGGLTYYNVSVSNGTTSASTTSIDASNTFQDLTDSSAGVLTIAAPSTVNGNFNYSGAGGVTLNSGTGPLSVTGTFAATGAVTINGTSNAFHSTADIGSGANAVAINNASNHFYGDVNFNNTGNLTIAGGSNTFDGSVNIASNGTATISGTSNTFGNSVTNKTFKVTGTGGITINGSHFFGTGLTGCVVGGITQASNCFGGNVTLASGSNTFDSSFGTTTAGGGSLTANTGTTANLFSGTVTVAGNAALNSVTSDPTVTFSNTVNITGNLTLGSFAHFNDTLTVASASASTITSSNVFAKAVNFSGAGLTMTDSNNFSTIASSLNVAGALSIGIANKFHATAVLNCTGGNAPVCVAGGVTLKGDNNTFDGALTTTSSGDLIFHNTTNDNLVHDNTFTGAVVVAGVLTMNTTPYKNTFSSTLNVAGSGASSISGKGSGTAGNTFTNAVSIAGTTTINADSNTFSSTLDITGAHNLVFAAAATSNIFTSTVTVGGILTMNTGANSNQFQSTTTALSVSGSGTSSISASNIFGSGSSGSVTITNATGSSTIGDSNAFHGPFSFTGTNGSVTVGSSAGGNVFSSTFSYTNSGPASGSVTFTGAGNNVASGLTTLTFNGGGLFSIAGANTFQDFTVNGSSMITSSFASDNTFRDFTFTGSNSGGITFKGTGTSTFRNFTVDTAPKTVKVHTASTLSITNGFTATGSLAAAGSQITFSMDGGTTGVNSWNISANTTSVGGLNVADSTASLTGSTPHGDSFTCSTLSENCTGIVHDSGWTFTP